MPRAWIGHHRPIDCDPLDIDCGVVISGELMRTHDTTELSLAFAVTAFSMPTGATTLAGVSGIDKQCPHTGPLCFVADKRLQLAESPIAVSRSLPSPSNPRPLANAAQIFERNHPLRAFGFRNEPLADVVVGIFLKAPLATSELAQAAFGRPGADLLECLTAVRIPLAAALNMRAGKRLAVTVGCKIYDAQIDAKRTFSVDRFSGLNFASNKQIPLATDQGEICFSALCSEQFTLAFTAYERDGLPPIKRPDRNLGTFQVVGENAIVVGNRAMRLKRALCLPIEFIGIRDFADTAHRKLRSKVECLTHGLIGQFVEGKLPKGVAFPRHLADVIAGSIGRLKRSPERIGLFGRREQSDGGSQSHIMSISLVEHMCNWRAMECADQGNGDAPFLVLLLPLKRTGFRIRLFL